MAPSLDEQVNRYLDHLVVERGVAANTASSYRRDLWRYRDFLASCAIIHLGDVEESHVRDFLVASSTPFTEKDGLLEVDGVVHDVTDLVVLGGGLRRTARVGEQFGQVDGHLTGERFQAARALAGGRRRHRPGDQHALGDGFQPQVEVQGGTRLDRLHVQTDPRRAGDRLLQEL